ncbi:hypothetical protein GPALN_007978 [Globodera pallida]|nr:hypothetical protein GPALN_007978 [Globodera pallida]
MFPYEVLLDICKFLSRFDLLTLQLSSRRLRQFVADNAFYWPRHRCYRLTFLEFFAINTLCRAENLSDFPVDFSKKLSDRLSALQFAPSEDRVQLFLNETEPTFLLFEFTSGRKFFVQIGPFVTSQNVANLVFWLQQISDVFFEEEIRGMPKFSAQFLEWIKRNEFDQILRLRCKTFGCYEFEPFDQVLNFLRHFCGFITLEEVDRLRIASLSVGRPIQLELSAGRTDGQSEWHNLFERTFSPFVQRGSPHKIVQHPLGDELWHGLH